MSSRTTPTMMQPSQAGKSSSAIPHEKIAHRAYQKWCQRGCRHGAHQQDWLEAEAELRAEIGMPGMSTAAAATAPARPQPAAPAMPQKSAQRR